MIGSGKETSRAYALTWSLDGASGPDGPELELVYRIEAAEELYVSDRLWDFDAAKQRVPDPFGVYRFVAHQSLRLFFGQAPIPTNVQPRIVYKPLFSRVRAGEAHERKVRMKVPVDEYSSLARDIASPTELEEVTRAFLVIEYRLRSEMPADPEQPALLDPVKDGYMVYDPKRLVSSCETRPIAVKRRIEPIYRVALPNDPPLK
jgi:hypothetical protein